MCTAEITQADLDALNSRVLLTPDGQPYSLQEFASRVPLGTIIGVYTNDKAEEINNFKLTANDAPIINCWARHTFSNPRNSRTQRACLTSNDGVKLDAVVRLSINSPVF